MAFPRKVKSQRGGGETYGDLFIMLQAVQCLIQDVYHVSGLDIGFKLKIVL